MRDVDAGCRACVIKRRWIALGGATSPETMALVCVQVIKRTHSGQQLVQHDAERVDVAGRAQSLALDLLGTGVGQGHGPGGRRRTRPAGIGIEQLRNAEIQQLRLAAGADQDIDRLQVTMDDEIGVRVLDSRTHLDEQGDAFTQDQ